MDFNLSSAQNDMLSALRDTLSAYDDAYWLQCDQSGEFPQAFFETMAKGGWLGIAMPVADGGSGLGITEAALMMLEIAKKGGMTAASALHMNVFGPNTLVRHGSDEQRKRLLPDVIEGKTKVCFAVTEPNIGLDTTRMQTRAVKNGDHYVISGRKMWISTAQHAHKIMLVARTSPRDNKKPTDGITLFYTDLDRKAVYISQIEKMGRKAVDSNELLIDDWKIPETDRIGEEGMGFQYLLHSLNPERILIAAEATGIGLNAIERASNYAKTRVVFNRPIGMNQGIQHPLASSWAQLQAARLMMLQAAQCYDTGQEAGVAANAAKYLAAEAALEACRNALTTHGGMGYAKEYHVERLYREVMIPYLAPVSQQLALCHVAERALGLPKSY